MARAGAPIPDGRYAEFRRHWRWLAVWIWAFTPIDGVARSAAAERCGQTKNTLCDV
jgi:hypothetical protein